MKELLGNRKINLIIYLAVTISLSILMVANALVIERITSVNQKNEWTIIMIGTCLFLILQAINYFFQQYYADKTVKLLIKDVRVRILQQIKNTPGFEMTQKRQEAYLANLTSKLAIVEQAFFEPLFWGIYLICQFLVALILAIKINWLLSLFVISLTIPQMIVPVVARKSLTVRKKRVSKEMDTYVSEVATFLSGGQTWRTFHQADRFFERAVQTTNALQMAEIVESKTIQRVGTVNKFFSDLLYFGTWLIGAYFILNEQINLSLLVGFAQIVSSISFPLHSATGTVSAMIGGWAVVKEILPDVERDVANQQAPLDKKVAIELINLTYLIENKTILSKFNYQFERQKRYLVIGQSGSGKTSLFRLIFNEVLPSQGQVKYSNEIAYIPQETFVFPGTLEENLTLFAKEINKNRFDEVVSQVRLTHLKRQKLTNQTVSGGEKSRLSLARALYSGANFLVIDELSSALDKETQREIEEMLIASSLNFIYATHKYNQDFIEKFDEVIQLPKPTTL